MLLRNDKKRINAILNLIEHTEQPISLSNSSKIRRLLKPLPDQQIIESIGMADMPLIIYLLSFKYSTTPQLIPIENDLIIRVGKCNAANMSYLAAYLHFLRFENGELILEGTTSYPTVIGECGFGVWINGIPINCELKDVGLDLKKGISVYESRKFFKIKIQLKENARVSFFNEIAGVQTGYGRINSMRFAPVADYIPGQYFEKDNWVFFIEGRELVCRKISKEDLAKKEEIFQQSLKTYSPGKWEWAVKLRNYYYNNRNKKSRAIWIFMDRPERADDNARVLFQYVQNKPEIDSYFLISTDSADYEEIKKIGKTIAIYSEEHYRLALIADYIISSQCNGMIENPFWDDSEMFRDLYHRPKLIFLQHGVIKDDMSLTLNRFNTNFTGFITSTQSEWQSVLDYPYYYSENEVWLTGLPRFDELEDKKEKIILIMPSWRQGLMQQKWNEEKGNMAWVLKPGFEESAYVKAYKSLIQNALLHSLCQKYGYKIFFVAHPLLKPYMETLTVNAEFAAGSSNTSYKDFFAKGALLITDYSSVAFDFSRLRKPVIYYQFDKEQFYREHTYQPGYFDYTVDGFGEVCQREEELVAVIQAYMAHNCVLKEKYKQRIDSIWPTQESACKKIYERIINGTDECN